MHSAAIRSGAHRPGDRSRHALLLALARAIAVAGLAVAGWVALAALTDSASADTSPAHPEGAVRATAPVPGDRTLPGPPDTAELSAAVSRVTNDARDIGLSGTGLRDAGLRIRPAGEWRLDVTEFAEPVQRIGDDPVRYLQTRRHELLDGKDRTVRDVRDLADAAGVPSPRIGDLPEDVPLVHGLVHPIPEVRLAPAQAQPPAETSERQSSETGDAEADENAGASAVTAAPAPGCGEDRPACSTTAKLPKRCTDCFDDPNDPAPALPSGQDEPRTVNSGGGHSFTPVADLQNARYPAAPPAVASGVFHRTALADVSAPRRPSVVPD